MVDTRYMPHGPSEQQPGVQIWKRSAACEIQHLLARAAPWLQLLNGQFREERPEGLAVVVGEGEATGMWR